MLVAYLCGGARPSSASIIPGDPNFSRGPPQGWWRAGGVGSFYPSPCAGVPDHNWQPISPLPQVMDQWKVASRGEGEKFWSGCPLSQAGCAAPLQILLWIPPSGGGGGGAMYKFCSRFSTGANNTLSSAIVLNSSSMAPGATYSPNLSPVQANQIQSSISLQGGNQLPRRGKRRQNS